MFIPYKEVLDVYREGLHVPEDVTLMWCDDNYGYIRHFPTPEERQRKGGNGLYYHVSYWGRPHDYLWLGTFSPHLLYQQLSEAYKRGIQRMWILNVGDIKPAEYQLELFMDMAWNIEAVAKKGVHRHMQSFLARAFGADKSKALVNIMEQHYRLAFIRKPEFLGNTRCKEYGPGSEHWLKVKDLPWSDRYIAQRLAQYEWLSTQTERLWRNIPRNRRDAFFQLVKYPVQAAAQMNNKLLYAQLARHGKASWNKCQMAFDSIAALTKTYNNGFGNGGKWRGMMDFQPRKQPVFMPITAHDACPEPVLPNKTTVEALRNLTPNLPVHPFLGSCAGAIEIPKGKTAQYNIATQGRDSLKITLVFLPNHPINEGEGLKVSVACDGEKPQTADYATTGRSETWKENVLNNRATCTFSFPPARNNKRKLAITALTEGVVLDCIEILTDNKQ